MNIIKDMISLKSLKRVTAVVLAAVNLSAAVVFAEESKNVEYEYLDKIFGYASELYLDESVTKEEIMSRAIKKYLKDNPDAIVDLLKDGFSSLDDYCEYYSGEEYDQYVNDINHTFYGIGVVIQKDGEYVKVNQVMEGGSAFEAGLQVDDLIYEVDGTSMKGMSIDAVQQAVTGEINTSVNVVVLRNGEKIDFTMVRRPVNETTVDSLILDDNTAYISIINFAMKTASEFETVLNELDAKGITQIILDLRNNPGGYLISAVDIGKMIVPEGIIVRTMFRQPEENITYYSELKEPKYKFAVLVNENTASAAEILTGAMQDSKIAVVFGNTTFGKAVIQDMFNMRNGDSFKITTGRYLTRNGREINLKGIDPDYDIPNTTEKIDVSKYPVIDYQKSTSIGDKDENIRTIRERMRHIGYNITDTSDVFDETLEAYVLDFQINNSIAPTGALDRITMVQIENKFADSEVLVDNQLYKAYEYFGGTKEKLDYVLDNQ